jgi:4-alpha-glucanotransferase
MANKTSALHRLARLHGIDPVYIDELGHRQVTSDESVRRLLTLLGVKVGNDQAVRQAIHAAQIHPWRQVIKEAMVVHRRTRPNAFPVHLPMGSLPPASLALSLTIIDESGSEQVKPLSGKRLRVEASKRIDGVRYVRLALPFPRDLPDGYYRVHLQARAPSRQWEGTMTLVIAPEQCYLPSPQARGKKRKAKPQREERVWGLTVQLYGLRSERNWGIGDFGDLEDLITWAGRDLGAAMVGVNPLHALRPGGISPYSPSSRLFHHPLYLDVESIAEFHSRPQFEQALRRPAFQAQLARLRQSETVDYTAVQSLKWPVFEQLYRVFRTDHL